MLWPKSMNEEKTANTIQVESLEVEATADGSNTLIDRATGITYRSVYGAAAESAHVFVKGTRIFSRKGPWKILEFGLGAGTNILTTLAHYRELGLELQLNYHAIERSLIQASLGSQLHRDSAHPEDVDFLCSIFSEGSDAKTTFQHPNLNVCFTLWLGDFREAHLPKAYFDAVYHDPFGPQVNPDGWTDTWFKMAYAAMQPHGILTTYSAASAVRRAMAKAGLFLGTQPGSGGKREMTGASPALEHLSDYKPLPPSKQPGPTR